MAVYLLHSTEPLYRANGEKVQHYLGYVTDGCLTKRVDQHRRGKHTTPLVRAFLQANAELRLGAYWPMLTRSDERRIKRNGHLRDKCTICRAEDALRAIPEEDR